MFFMVSRAVRASGGIFRADGRLSYRRQEGNEGLYRPVEGRPCRVEGRTSRLGPYAGPATSAQGSVARQPGPYDSV
jgi:hypothetical protein